MMAWRFHAIEQTHSPGQDVASMAWWRLKFDSYTGSDVRDEHPQRLLGGDAARRLAQRGRRGECCKYQRVSSSRHRRTVAALYDDLCGRTVRCSPCVGEHGCIAPFQGRVRAGKCTSRRHQQTAFKLSKLAQSAARIARRVGLRLDDVQCANVRVLGR